MGVCGEFIRISKEKAEQLQNGEIHVFDLLEADNESDCLLDIYKYWHIIDFVLVGNTQENGDNPLSKVVLGNGIPVGDEDDIAALLKTPVEISEINQAFATVSEKTIREGFSLAEMKEHDIYLANAYNNEDEVFRDIYGTVESISHFFKEAEQHNQWILLFLS